MQITIAANWPSRLRGLIGRGRLGPEEAILITRCRQVHTWFMAYPIDAVFMDANGMIVRVFTHLMPWQTTPRVPGASECLELADGSAGRHKLEPGRKCIIEEC